MSFKYDYPRPMVCVDILVFSKIQGKLFILLIERLNDPFKNKWALPGGFIEMEEDLIDSAYRELKEETSISTIRLKQFKAYGKPGRDPRGRTISVIFYGTIENSAQINAGDDAKDSKWFSIYNLPELAFDHNQIVEDFLTMNPEIDSFQSFF